MSQAKLHVIGTPLGNREDITLRALRTLRELRVLFAEDTRELKKLLEMHGISADGKQLFSHAAHNLKESAERAVEFLAAGQDVGLTSDRGTPAISDPGAWLVSHARARGFGVVPVPGPSAVTTLLSVSGMPSDRFTFLGFLSREAKPRREVWDEVERLQWTAVFFESPRRLPEIFAELRARFPRGQFCFGREMTKTFEEYRTGNFADALPALDERGEYVVVFAPGAAAAAAAEVGAAWHAEAERRQWPDRAFAKFCAAQHGVAANDVYRELQRLKRAAKGEGDAAPDDSEEC